MILELVNSSQLIGVNDMFGAFKIGWLLGLSIIISIGAQNLFLIKQGLRNEQPYLCAFMCFLCDFILISLGAIGVSEVILALPVLKFILLAFGVIFLAYYGSLAIKRGFDLPAIDAYLKQIKEQNHQVTSTKKLILLALSFSVLNPQSLLDSTMIIGSNANYFNHEVKLLFVSGAITASFCWFFGISLATQYFGKKLMNSRFWSVLECISGISMIIFAFKFLLQLPK